MEKLGLKLIDWTKKICVTVKLSFFVKVMVSQCGNTGILIPPFFSKDFVKLTLYKKELYFKN